MAGSAIAVTRQEMRGRKPSLHRAYAHFAEAAAKWLLGDEPFPAKLNPAYAPYGIMTS